MMFDVQPSAQQLESHKDSDPEESSAQPNPSTNFNPEIDQTIRQGASLSDPASTSNISNTSSSNSDQQIDQSDANSGSDAQHHHRLILLEQNSHPIQYQGRHLQYFIESNLDFSSNKYESTNSSHRAASTSSNVKIENQLSSSSIGIMNADATQHLNMVPTAHCSDNQIQYSLPMTKVSDSNLALNFSHDLLHQASHQQNHLVMHSDANEMKSHVSQPHHSIELDPSGVIPPVGMNIWKNTMSLNHFKHPIADHGFLPTSDINSLSNWTHGNSVVSQSSGMNHHLLESQHLIGYTQSHRSQMSIPNHHESIGASMKSHTTNDQTTFKLNSINHHASTSQSSISNHQTSQSIDNLNLRSDMLDHSASYNLASNDNQFYDSSRSEIRSHPNTVKSSFQMNDRSVQISLNNRHGQLSYLETEQTNLQPTTSQHLAGSSSSSSSSKNANSFRCPTCNEVFPLRTVYQNHLKTHSQDKGEIRE